MYLNAILRMLSGGGEDPKSKKNTYTSVDEITRDNNWLRGFLERRGAPMASTSVLARDIGDAKPKFIYPNGQPNVDKPILQKVLPLGVSINDVFQTNEGQYGFYHPQNGNFVQVDPQSVYSKYGGINNKK